MQAKIHAILARQYVGKTGNGTITLLDLDTGREFTATIQGGALDDSVFTVRAPHHYIIDGLEMRRGDNGVYLVCSGLYDADTKKQ